MYSDVLKPAVVFKHTVLFSKVNRIVYEWRFNHLATVFHGSSTSKGTLHFYSCHADRCWFFTVLNPILVVLSMLATSLY